MSPRTFALTVGLPIVGAVVLILALVASPADQRVQVAGGALVAAVAGLSVASVGVFGGVLVPGLLLIGIDTAIVAPLSLMLQVLIIPLAAASHYSQGNVSHRVTRPLIAGGLLGALGGVAFVSFLRPDLVARLIALVIIGVGLLVLATMRFRGLGQERGDDVPTGRVAGIGFVAGFPTAISGAGWGPVGVTLLILSRFETRIAVGSSTFGRIFIALASVGFYILLGKGSALQNVVNHWWLLPALWAGAILAILPGSMIIGRIGRTRGTIAVTILSISLAIPTLIFGR